MCAPAGHCIPLKSSLSYLQGSGAIVNPLTAIALLERVKTNGHGSFVNTAAAGALGKMLNRLAKDANLLPINIVRSEQQMHALREMGAKEIINLSQPDFEEKLAGTFARLQPKVILDAIGGSFTNQLLALAPSGAILVLYASLSREMLHVNPAPLIRFGKTIEGFHLADWTRKQSKLKMLFTARKAQKLMVDGTLTSPIAKQFSLANINDALTEYAANMSAGKHVLVL